MEIDHRSCSVELIKMLSPFHKAFKQKLKLLGWEQLGMERAVWKELIFSLGPERSLRVKASKVWSIQIVPLTVLPPCWWEVLASLKKKFYYTQRNIVGKCRNLTSSFQIFLGRETHRRHSLLQLIFKTSNQCQQHKEFCKIAQKLGWHLSRQTVSGYLE